MKFNYIYLFKKDEEFNLMMFGIMMGIVLTSIASVFIFCFMQDRFLSIYVFYTFFGTLFALLSHAQWKKLKKVRR